MVRDAILSCCNERNEVTLSKVKFAAVKLCEKLELRQLSKIVGNSKSLSLSMFFAVKTHKPESPLRVIVTEQGTWKKAVGCFLQKYLNELSFEDPFQIKNSEQIISYLKSNDNRSFQAFSVDVKYLYYSLPHELIPCSVEERIDQFGAIAFQRVE
ncbi:hypothetical protein HPB48_003133 [Haemaphysalis longicornis]|uniref:Tick transposon n=1 Tax=Haemaphysalis longicornis TaxID=44386 RepID=A0A9J6FC15_HAELO|nr:hypothetical protein HPB48_003133 [Haemaphysalis longicornis]